MFVGECTRVLRCPYPSLGPVMVQTTEVLPITTRLLPSLAGWVEIDTENLRSSFQRRPSCRKSVEEYVDDVSRGIDADVLNYSCVIVDCMNERIHDFSKCCRRRV